MYYYYLMYNGYHTLKELVQLKTGAPSSHPLSSPQPFTSYLHSTLQNMKKQKSNVSVHKYGAWRRKKNHRSMPPPGLYTLKIQAEGNHSKHLYAI